MATLFVSNPIFGLAFTLYVVLTGSIYGLMQICINQDDVTEKNQQVRMMDQIYQNATVVSVWLGLVPSPDWLNIEGPIVTFEVDDFDWAESMGDLANRPYWTRSWIIQEYMLAREIHVYCSNHRVEGQFFRDLLEREAGIDLLGIKDDDLAAQSDLIRKWPALPINFGRDVDRMPELYQPLYDLLVRHGNAQSEDPRDKVFALLGLVPREERISLLKSFPNYSLSMEQVNAVTLSHAQSFAIGQPLEPIFRALRIPEGRDRRLRLDQPVCFHKRTRTRRLQSRNMPLIALSHMMWHGVGIQAGS